MQTKDTALKRRNSLILALTSFIWGISFVSQSQGGDAIGPYSFNCIRSIIGSLFLIIIISVTDRFGLTKKPDNKKAQRTLLTGGVLCGVVLCVATNLQQMGIYLGTPSGKAGFLTACYILLVPILGLFFKKKCGINVWIAVAISIVGLYLLCIDGTFRLQFSDILVMICALCFSIHILVIDHFSPMVDRVSECPVFNSWLQVCFLLFQCLQPSLTQVLQIWLFCHLPHGCMASSVICRNLLLWNCIYTTDYRSKRS